MLSQALCWLRTRGPHRRIPSPPFQKGSEIPKDNRRDKEKLKVREILQLQDQLPGPPGPHWRLGVEEGGGRSRRLPPRVQEPSSVSRNPSCFVCFALSRTKKAKKWNKREIALRVGMNHSESKVAKSFPSDTAQHVI